MEKSKGGVEIYRTIMVGGSSVVTLGNAVRPSEATLKNYGIELEDEFREAERELHVSPFPEEMMGERTRRLKTAAEELGYNVKPMPKSIDFSKCRGCGMCVTGCKYGAKWSSQMYIGDVFRAGARMLLNTSVDRVLHSGGEVKGVKVHSAKGSYEIEAKNVILAAGGIGTPIILQKSGLTNAGRNLFVDLFVNTYGMIDSKMEEEAGMATLIDEFHSEHGFILSPIMDTSLHMFLYLPIFQKTRALRRDKLLGIMTKISDEDSGMVHADGTISKSVTSKDDERLR
ncbi:MAG: ferredoxin, partial [Archaeoglobales archaeon]